MSIFDKLTQFVDKVFKTSLEVFYEALKMSPNAQGYVSGSVTELLLKKYLISLGYEVERIREKWEGKKHPNHHGDFYFKKDSNWFVLESKGVKSNTEKWNGLYNYEKLKKFLFTHSEKICWINQDDAIEPQIEKWIKDNLPKFFSEYKDTLYGYEDIQKYSSTKKSKKALAIEKLKDLTREEISVKIDERLDYLMTKIKVLDTHFVSGKGGDRTQATPRKEEFNVISIDIFLRYSEHKFLFANPKNLDSSEKDEEHLKQNYIMGFVFNDNELCLTDEWSEDINEVLKTIKKDESINENDMQIDFRLENSNI